MHGLSKKGDTVRIHNNTIRKYTQAILNQMKDIDVQYLRTDGSILNKKVPLVYGSSEKSSTLDFIEQAFREKGNYSVLPRQQLSMVQITKSEDRVTNKLLKKNILIHERHQEFIFNPIPYEFTFEYSQICRGMNEAQQVIECVQTKFNPTLDIDIWDQANMETPTRIPVKLLDIGIEDEGFSETSTNLITVTQSLSLIGNMYQPNTVAVTDGMLNTKDGDDISIVPSNSRIMPIIRQVGYSIAQTPYLNIPGDSSPEGSLVSISDPDPSSDSKPEVEISKIGFFDVDERGYLVCAPGGVDRPEVVGQIQIDRIHSTTVEALELLDNFTEESELTNHEVRENMEKAITLIRSDVFQALSAVTGATNTEYVKIFQELHAILWGHDNNETKLRSIQNLTY